MLTCTIHFTERKETNVEVNNDTISNEIPAVDEFCGMHPDLKKSILASREAEKVKAIMPVSNEDWNDEIVHEGR